MNRSTSKLLVSLLIILSLSACSTPEEKAEKYYEKGMALVDTDPDKARLEFQNALQLKRNMTKAMYGMALVAEKKGDWKQTYGLLNKVLEQDPSHLQALVKTGQILLAGQRLDLAKERCDKALAIDKNSYDALNLSAAIKLKQGDLNGAVQIANDVLAKDPKNQDAYTVLATERLTAKDDVKAVEFLDKALAINNKNMAIHLIKISTLEKLSKLNEADAAYKSVIEVFPDASSIRSNYAQFLAKNNRLNEAEVQMRKIAEIEPNNLEAKINIVRFLIATKDAPAGRAELEKMVNNEPKNFDLAFALVNLYQVQKDSASEDKALKGIVERAGNTPDGFKARVMVATKLLKTGKKDEASKMLDEILREDSANENALMLRASIAMQAKNYESAIMDLRTAAKETSNASAPTFLLAKVHESTGSYALADEQYLLAFQGSKFSAEYGVPYAEFLLRRKQPERAEKVLNDVVEHNPLDKNAYRLLAQSKLSRGDKAGAEAIAQKLAQTGDKSPLAQEILGAIAASKNDVEGTLTAFKKAYEMDPNQPQAMVAVVKTYLAVGRNKEAIDFIQSVLKSNPNNNEAKLLLGQTYFTTGDVAKATSTFNAYIAASPNDPVAYQQLVIVQQRTNQLAEAEKTVAKGLTVAPKDYGLLLAQANLFELNGRVEDAIKTYEMMLKEHPEADVANNNLASLLAENKTDTTSLDRAYKLASAFKNSEIPQFLDTYAWASFKANRLDDAEQAIKKAVEKSPNDPVFQYHYGKILVARNEKIEAKKAFEKVLALTEKQSSKYKDDAIVILKAL